MIHRGVLRHKRMSRFPQEIQNIPRIRKPKQIKTTKNQNLMYH